MNFVAPKTKPIAAAEPAAGFGPRDVGVTDERSREMRDIADAVVVARVQRVKFDGDHEVGEISHLHRKNKKHQNQLIRINFADRDENREDHARCSDGRYDESQRIEQAVKRDDKAGDEAGDENEFDETPRAPDFFEKTAEHPEGEHIEEQMGETAVQKNPRERLVDHALKDRLRNETEKHHELAIERIAARPEERELFHHEDGRADDDERSDETLEARQRYHLALPFFAETRCA